MTRLFIAEEQNHAGLLAMLLRSAGAAVISSHWSDTVFVWLRRALGSPHPKRWPRRPLSPMLKS